LYAKTARVNGQTQTHLNTSVYFRNGVTQTSEEMKVLTISPNYQETAVYKTRQKPVGIMDTGQPEKLGTLFGGPSRHVVELQASVKKLTTDIEGLKTKYESFHSDLQRERQIFQQFMANYIAFRRNVYEKLDQISDILGSSASGDEERYDDMPDIIQRLEDLESKVRKLRRDARVFNGR